MRKNLRIISLLMTLVMAVTIVFVPIQSQAASGSIKKLKAEKTYKSYDVTGNGKKDTIKITQSGYNGDMYKSFKISINGKKAYSYTEREYPGFYEVEAKLITLSNNKKFLFVNSYSWDGDSTICAIFKYKSGKLKKVVDFVKYYQKYGYHGGADVTGVAGNSIKVKFWTVNYSIGLSDYQMTFRYKGGTLKQDKTKAKLINGWRDGNKTKRFTINKSIKAYTSPTSGTTAFKLKYGDVITIDQVRVTSSKMMFRVKCGSRTGWIRALTSYPQSESSYMIRNPHYSG